MSLQNLVVAEDSLTTIESLRASYGSKNLAAYAEYLRTGMIAASALKFGITVVKLRQLHKELRTMVELCSE